MRRPWLYSRLSRSAQGAQSGLDSQVFSKAFGPSVYPSGCFCIGSHRLHRSLSISIVFTISIDLYRFLSILISVPGSVHIQERDRPERIDPAPVPWQISPSRRNPLKCQFIVIYRSMLSEIISVDTDILLSSRRIPSRYTRERESLRLNWREQAYTDGTLGKFECFPV